MRKFYMVFILFISVLFCVAQVPDRISYQSVVRDSHNELVREGAVGLRISLLQGSAEGEAVYVEEHLVRSNANGLVSIAIGGGTVVSGDYSRIDWGAGPYFIKTETDPAGGTSYSLTGISQLLTVPYALHARMADSVRGGLTERDPVYASSVAGGITESDTSQWHKKQDRLIAGPGLTIIGNVISLAGPVTYSVGDFAQGGIVFWVDETGEHGLVAAKEDQSTGIRWYAGSYGVTGATGDGVYAGKANTASIIAGHATIGDDGEMYAARLCDELEVMEGGKTYGDWYLPSKEELNLMYTNRAVIDSVAQANEGSGFASARYWSSTEINLLNAWIQNFGNGNQDFDNKHLIHRVRAVRAF